MLVGSHKVESNRHTPVATVVLRLKFRRGVFVSEGKVGHAGGSPYGNPLALRLAGQTSP
jgi:hypothetical protein